MTPTLTASFGPELRCGFPTMQLETNSISILFTERENCSLDGLDPKAPVRIGRPFRKGRTVSPKSSLSERTECFLYD